MATDTGTTRNDLPDSNQPDGKRPETGATENSGTTLVVLVAITLVMLFLGLRWATQDYPDLSSYADNSTCLDTRVAAGQSLHTSEVVVSVYNASTKSGLASTTMRELMERGFAAGSTGNSPTAEVKKVEIWSDSVNPAALLVAEQFGKGTRIVSGRPDLGGDGVIVVLGDGYRKLRPPVESIVAKTEAYICGPRTP